MTETPTYESGQKTGQSNQAVWPDAKVVEFIADAQKDALSELYTRYAGLQMSIAYRILRNQLDAEDLLHDVYIEVWNKAGSYNPARGSVKTWLTMITRSRAIDRLRSLKIAREHAMQKTMSESSLEANSVDFTPETMTENAQLRTAVDKLVEEQRKVLLLNYFEGLTCEEIARKLGTPLGTTKSRLRAAVKALRIIMVQSEQRS